MNNGLVTNGDEPGGEGITMKITKRQLRRIIKEEKRKILCEGVTQENALIVALDDYVNALVIQLEVPRGALKGDVEDIVDEYFKQIYKEDDIATEPWGDPRGNRRR